MNARTYCLLSGVVFLLVALAHGVRALAQWPLRVAQWDVPVDLSWLAAVGAALLALWAFAARRRG